MRHRTPLSLILLSLALGAALLGACASTPPPIAAAQPDEPRWSVSRRVETNNAMITLFDPSDLDHHTVEPPDWYRHDFGFDTDLATGRFAAVLLEDEGTYAVRVTTEPLGPRERAVAGPEAAQRLRVVDRRLLLAGGDAWPSVDLPHVPAPDDPRWLDVPNGDYRVTISVLDDPDGALHDVVFRLEPVESIDAVAYAPGIPQLVVGWPPAVAGTTTASLRFRERCGEVPRAARWSPLVGRALPLPGGTGAIEVIEGLHERGRLLQNAALPGEGPLIVARAPVVGELGVSFVPTRWLAPRREQGRYRELFEVRGRASCAVRITAVEGERDVLTLAVEPLPTARAPLPRELGRELVERFEEYVRVSNDPAWRYKSGWVRRAPDDTSLVFAVMRHLGLSADEIEALLVEDNETRARRLLERMTITGRAAGGPTLPVSGRPNRA